MNYSRKYKVTYRSIGNLSYYILFLFVFRMGLDPPNTKLQMELKSDQYFLNYSRKTQSNLQVLGNLSYYIYIYLYYLRQKVMDFLWRLWPRSEAEEHGAESVYNGIGCSCCCWYCYSADNCLIIFLNGIIYLHRINGIFKWD